MALSTAETNFSTLAKYVLRVCLQISLQNISIGSGSGVYGGKNLKTISPSSSRYSLSSLSLLWYDTLSMNTTILPNFLWSDLIKSSMFSMSPLP